MSDYQRWLEGEISDSDLARLQAGKVNHIIDSIKTESGKRLWTKINDNHGSYVWGPVWDGIVEIEAEMEERIIKMLEEHPIGRTGDGYAYCRCSQDWWDGKDWVPASSNSRTLYNDHIKALIKGEK